MTIYPGKTPYGSADIEIGTGNEGTTARVHIPSYAAANAKRYEIRFNSLSEFIAAIHQEHEITLSNPHVLEQMKTMLEKEIQFAQMNFH